MDGIPLQPRPLLWESSGSSFLSRLALDKSADSIHGCPALQCRTCRRIADRAIAGRGNTLANPASSRLPNAAPRELSDQNTYIAEIAEGTQSSQRKHSALRLVHHTQLRLQRWTFSDRTGWGLPRPRTSISNPLVSDNVQLLGARFDNLSTSGEWLWLGVFAIAWSARNAALVICLDSVPTRMAHICFRQRQARLPNGPCTARADRLRARADGVATICDPMRSRDRPTFAATDRRTKSFECAMNATEISETG